MRDRLGVNLRRSLDSDSRRGVAQHLDGQSGLCQDRIVAAVGIEIEHSIAEAKFGGDVGGLAKRLDKSVPDLEVSTARAAIAHIRGLLSGTATPAPATAGIMIGMNVSLLRSQEKHSS